VEAPSLFNEGVQVLGYDDDDDTAINEFEPIHVNDELNINEEQKGEEEDDDDDDDEEYNLDEVDREAFTSSDWDVLLRPEKCIKISLNMFLVQFISVNHIRIGILVPSLKSRRGEG
jgi:hypothetical protein